MANCTETHPIVGCFVPTDLTVAPVGITIHYSYDSTEVPVRTVYSEADHTTTIDVATYLGGGDVIPGSCPVPHTDFEQLIMCDDTDNDSSTEDVQFVRTTVRTYRGDTATLVTETITDTELDLITPYVVVGTVKQCGDPTYPPITDLGLQTAFTPVV